LRTGLAGLTGLFSKWPVFLLIILHRILFYGQIEKRKHGLRMKTFNLWLVLSSFVKGLQLRQDAGPSPLRRNKVNKNNPSNFRHATIFTKKYKKFNLCIRYAKFSRTSFIWDSVDFFRMLYYFSFGSGKVQWHRGIAVYGIWVNLAQYFEKMIFQTRYIFRYLTSTRYTGFGVINTDTWYFDKYNF